MKISVTTTPHEIIDKGVWDEFCQMRGYSEWCVNEGQLHGDEEITLNEEEAIKLGLIACRRPMSRKALREEAEECRKIVEAAKENVRRSLKS